MLRMPVRRRTRVALAASVAVGALVVGVTSVHARPFQAEAATDEDPPTAQQLPESYQWTSTGTLIGPKPDASHQVVSVKDPTMVRHDDEWLVYMTTANTAGAWSLAYTSFGDWGEAAAAPQSFLDTNPNIGTRYAAAPHMFYFEPGDEWCSGPGTTRR